MPTKVKTPAKRTPTANVSRTTVRDLVAVASQLPDSQLQSLRKKLDELHIARWELDRQEIAKQIADKGITEQSSDEYIMRRRRENRR